MEIDYLAWLSLSVRWLHFVAGIAWIGASFYFVWLDNSLRPPAKPKDGVGGELWAVHGGGFYHNQKFLVAPPHMPEELHWFKWEAYTTWLSGFALLIIIYYLGADLYLIDPAKSTLDGGTAVLIGLATLLGGWFVYDLLCRSPLGKDQRVMGAIWFVALVGLAYGLTRIFSDKGAFIHVGALIGTVMVANVFFVIIPNQRKSVAAMLAGEPVDPALGAAGKQRSVHNNYMTLPVLLTMISSHYPMLVGHDWNWLLLAVISVAAIITRHYFNLKHQGNEQKRLLVIAAVIFLGAIGAASIKPASAGVGTGAAEVIAFSEVRTIIDTHCAQCHSATPTHPAFNEAQAGLSFDDDAVLRANSRLIYDQTVASDLMPLGNESGMTEEERQLLGAWTRQEAGE